MPHISRKVIRVCDRGFVIQGLIFLVLCVFKEDHWQIHVYDLLMEEWRRLLLSKPAGEAAYTQISFGMHVLRESG
jgi:hypothetical protein